MPPSTRVPAGVPVQEVRHREYRDGAWTDTAFWVAGNTVIISGKRPGIFALFAPVHPVVTSTEVITEWTHIPSTTVTTTLPTPTKAGLELSILVLGFLGLMIIGTRRKHL